MTTIWIISREGKGPGRRNSSDLKKTIHTTISSIRALNNNSNITSKDPNRDHNNSNISNSRNNSSNPSNSRFSNRIPSNSSSLNKNSSEPKN